jgi:hypothetical protein
MSKRKARTNSILLPLMGVVSGVAVSVAYLRVIRPWMLSWGIQQEDLLLSYQGEGMLPNPKIDSMHAVTIDAPPSRVWPWLVQLGQGKGGFYSYDFLENMAGLDIHTANQIIPEWQSLKVGDRIMLGQGIGVPVVVVEPERAVVMHGDTRQENPAAGGQEGMMPPMRPGDYLATTWGFYLNETGDGRTRLVSRWLADWNPSLLNSIFYRVFLEPIAFLMERKMLLGIKERAENY